MLFKNELMRRICNLETMFNELDDRVDMLRDTIIDMKKPKKTARRKKDETTK